MLGALCSCYAVVFSAGESEGCSLRSLLAAAPGWVCHAGGRLGAACWNTHTCVRTFAGLFPAALALFGLVSGLLKARVIRAVHSGICSSHILLCIRQRLPYNV